MIVLLDHVRGKFGSERIPLTALRYLPNSTNQLFILKLVLAIVYTHSFYANILPTKWFRLAHSQISYPSKIFPRTDMLIVVLEKDCSLCQASALLLGSQLPVMLKFVLV